MPKSSQFATEREAPVVLAAIKHILDLNKKSPIVASVYGFNTREIKILNQVINRAKNAE